MRTGHLFGIALILGWALIPFRAAALSADDGYDLWMKYRLVDDARMLEQYRQAVPSVFIAGDTGTSRKIAEELRRGLRGLLGSEVPREHSAAQPGCLVIGTPGNSDIVSRLGLAASLASLGREGFVIKTVLREGKTSLVIAANEEVGLLYGTFHLLRMMQTRQDLAAANVTSRPKIQYRLLNHWDNLDGTIERGYAGRSLWKWDELPDKTDPRYEDYARANASIGINGSVINNVNANPNILRAEYLKKIAKLADLFRPYGIRVFLSVNFASPISAGFTLEGNRKGGIGDIDVADPLNPRVRTWWKTKADEIYRLIPDFGGFLVKANSEGMPGPQDYARSHAEGANMLAEALAPHGGVVMWRAFVYNAEVDEDRAKRAYKEFVPLDGRFSANVFVQAKNGPVDFQPREPVQPLFGSMPKTPLMLELQITQEYLGHSTHLVYLAPMWKEYFQFDTHAAGTGSTLAGIVDGTVHHSRMTGIAGVANIGNDRNWCGHFFGQANWFAFGRLSWDHALGADVIADEWIRMSLGGDKALIEKVQAMMLGSWEACVSYMTPLGLHHIMQEGFHYGPAPQHARGRQDWTSVYYHRAGPDGVGFDRSSTGSGATAQYFQPVRGLFDDIKSCPEKYLLWFHHAPWDRTMKSGRTLLEELSFKYWEGTRFVDSMLDSWQSLESRIDPEVFRHVEGKLRQQRQDSVVWRKTCLEYFQKFANQDIRKN